MFDNIGRAAASCAFALGASGCVATPFYGKPMTDRIVLDTADFSKAYSDAVDSQILLNVLYSRDRLPRHYLTIKEITTTQKRSMSANPKIGGLPLGNPATDTGGAKLWGVGDIGISGTAETSPDYGIAPLVSKEFVEGALNPVSGEIFLKYWDAGWPKDVLLAILATRACRLPDKDNGDGGGKSSGHNCQENNTLENSGEELSRGADTDFLAFARFIKEPPKGVKISAEMSPTRAAVRTLLSSTGKVQHSISTGDFVQVAQSIAHIKAAGYDIEIDKPGRLEIVSNSKPPEFVMITIDCDPMETICGEVAIQRRSLKTTGYCERKANKTAPNCKNIALKMTGENSLAVQKPIGRWIIDLRSFDQAIYYVGELIRIAEEDSSSTYGPNWAVTAADCDKSLEKSIAPLFQVTRRNSALPIKANGYPRVASNGIPDGEDPIWAARVQYRGAWYFAGPSAPMIAECEGENAVDRTGTVLTLLGQILEMNRSQDSVVLPARLQ